METKLMLNFVCLLAGCLFRNLASGKDLRTAPEANKTPYSTALPKEKLEGHRNESVEMGANVTLYCIKSDTALKNMIYVIWKIKLQGKNCSVAVSENDPEHDTCQDGKKLNWTADGTYNLIIPHFSVQDEGNYTCDVSYKSGGYVENIYVSAWAPPIVDSWLETEQGNTVAVCTATSRPPASIHWKSLDGKYSTSTTQTFMSKEGIYTVTSRFYLPQKGFYTNLTCMASHLKQTVTRYNFPPHEKSLRWPFILLGVLATCITVIALTLLYIMREKLKQLRVFKKICCKPSVSTKTEEKNKQASDAEEVQPYASYVQRVNSIYNSSAELFNA